MRIESWMPRIVLALILSSLSATSCLSPAINQIMPGNAGMSRSDARKDSSAVDQLNQAIAAAALQTSLSSDDYRIGPEDLVEITVFNIPTTEATVTPRSVTLRVSQQGRLAPPLLGEIDVKGLTVASFEELLRRKYEKYIRNPQVGVLVKEYRQRVSVIGAVQKPGVFELSGPKTVIDMLAQAGGVSDRAGSQVHIYRQTPKGRESEVIDLLVLTTSAGLINEANAGLIVKPVEAGDVINVPMAGMFFVQGAVRSAGSFPLGRNYTLTQAISVAGGLNEELADPAGVTILRRRNNGEVQSIPVDLREVSVGTTTDPQIQVDDLIMIPMSTAKYVWTYYVSRILGTTLSIKSLVFGF